MGRSPFEKTCILGISILILNTTIGWSASVCLPPQEDPTGLSETIEFALKSVDKSTWVGCSKEDARDLKRAIQTVYSLVLGSDNREYIKGDSETLTQKNYGLHQHFGNLRAVSYTHLTLPTSG